MFRTFIAEFKRVVIEIEMGDLHELASNNEKNPQRVGSQVYVRYMSLLSDRKKNYRRADMLLRELEIAPYQSAGLYIKVKHSKLIITLATKH